MAVQDSRAVSSGIVPVLIVAAPPRNTAESGVSQAANPAGRKGVRTRKVQKLPSASTPRPNGKQVR